MIHLGYDIIVDENEILHAELFNGQIVVRFKNGYTVEVHESVDEVWEELTRALIKEEAAPND